jgi:tripartite-type tricarboxylate transporter receptor subunit TctC
MRKFAAALTFAFIALGVIALSSSIRPDNYPSRPVTLIVPFPPGGSTDVAARILADKMSGALGQPVIVENVGGAGGSIGVGRLARATPDGYTIDIGQWDTHAASSTISASICAPISRPSG